MINLLSMALIIISFFLFVVFGENYLLFIALCAAVLTIDKLGESIK